MTPEYALTILGAPATKKNGGTLRRFGVKKRRVESAAFRRFEALAVPQLRQQWAAVRMQAIDEPVNVRALFYLAADYLSDVHGYYQGLADLLVLAGVLEDDNRKVLASWDGSRVYVDRKRPRIEVFIELLSSITFSNTDGHGGTRGRAWHGRAWHGRAWHGRAGQGRARQG